MASFVGEGIDESFYRDSALRRQRAPAGGEQNLIEGMTLTMSSSAGETFKRILRKTPLIGPAREIRRWIRMRPVEGPLTYKEDGLATQHRADFLSDPKFVSAMRAGDAAYAGSGSRFEQVSIRWRVYTLCWAAAHAVHLDGDFVECGVNLGRYSSAVTDYVGFEKLDKTFYLLDTFKGWDPGYMTEAELAYHRLHDENYYPDCYDRVCRTFAKYPNVKIIRGPVPETLTQVPSNKVAYLSIDMNAVIPEIAAGEFFWEKLVPGAVVVLDDYGWHGYEQQKDGWDDFARRHGIEIMLLPTGQGFFIKPGRC